jgi:hypothetical protein
MLSEDQGEPGLLLASLGQSAVRSNLVCSGDSVYTCGMAADAQARLVASTSIVDDSCPEAREQ